MSNKTKVFLAIVIVLLAASTRLVKHPYNFTPVAAMSLFAGCYLRKYWGLVFPLGAMIVSDYFIGFYDWQVMASVYLSIALSFFIGWFLYKRLKFQNVILSALLSSVVFFLITNFAVWAFFNWYPHTWAGLADCFFLAIPFFKNTIFVDLFYSLTLFGVYEFVLNYGKMPAAVRQEKNI